MSVAVLGIDIAKQKFDVALLVEGKTKHKTCKNSAEGFEMLSLWLEKQGGVYGPIRIAVIQGTKGNMSARMLTDPELQGHNQALSYMKISMQKLADSHKQEDSTTQSLLFKIKKLFCTQTDPFTENLFCLHFIDIALLI